MTVITTDTGLFYDDANPRCGCEIVHSQGKNYAFVQCLDIGIGYDGKSPMRTPEEAFVKQYWGEIGEGDPAPYIARILKYGGKWPDLKWAKRRTG